ncbi:SHOCT domain-containing protein [Paeniglutamicibacter gangotriensis]|uniref:SHOCT domain-containing protein n=1 Tax=Paeniglutamicibacter gangotriensis TaxID=254787 RepID=A0A5B0E422_9MICC|nr:SHOCT domain-containing protein [Paeniglutamicibacter gangotriensis]KAA0973416.1 SHOCT domain-containing protein [Paeniglutamicibacter gangotriensis]
MFWYGNDANGWGMVLMIASMVLFWGAVITGITLLVRPSRPGLPKRGSMLPMHTAEGLLAERFARGEIDQDEYVTRLAVLRQKPGS